MQGTRFDPRSGKIPRATEQLSQWATTTEPAHHNYWSRRALSPCAIYFLENKTDSEWLKFRPTSQNPLSPVLLKHWSTEQVLLGITVWLYSGVHMGNMVYDLDAGSRHFNGITAINCLFVQRFKSHVIWVQTGVILVGFCLLQISSSMKGQEQYGLLYKMSSN